MTTQSSIPLKKGTHTTAKTSHIIRSASTNNNLHNYLHSSNNAKKTENLAVLRNPNAPPSHKNNSSVHQDCHARTRISTEALLQRKMAGWKRPSQKSGGSFPNLENVTLMRRGKNSGASGQHWPGAWGVWARGRAGRDGERASPWPAAARDRTRREREQNQQQHLAAEAGSERAKTHTHTNPNQTKRSLPACLPARDVTLCSSDDAWPSPPLLRFALPLSFGLVLCCSCLCLWCLVCCLGGLGGWGLGFQCCKRVGFKSLKREVLWDTWRFYTNPSQVFQ